jgi:glycosyltransferase involved in cell wall biosynthesis
MNKISVVIPCFNEELAIRENVGEVVKTLKVLERPWELIIVNDGSTDGTLPILQSLERENHSIRVISYAENRGRGFALKLGFRSATGDYVIATESDLNWGSEIIVRFIKELDKGEADIVIASPHLRPGRMENVPFSRWLLSYLGNKIFSVAFPGRLTMVTGMTRGYKKEVLDSIDFESNDKDLHVEILWKALDLGYKVIELPAVLRWKKATPGKPVRKSHFKPQSIIKHLLLTFNVRPYLLFSFFAVLLFVIAGMFGTYLFRESQTVGVAGRPLLFVTILLILIGFQMLVFGFLATQNRDTKRQLVRIQKLLKDRQHP